MRLYFLLKRREFDGFLGFFVGSENPSVHRRTRIFGFCKNAEKARIVAVLIKEFGVLGQGQDSFVRRRKAELFAV